MEAKKELAVAPAGRNGANSLMKWWWFDELGARRKRSKNRQTNVPEDLHEEVLCVLM